MKRIMSTVLLCGLLLGLLSGCQTTSQEAYVPTGSGLTWDESENGSGNNQITDQALTLTYYPDITMNPLLCTDFTNRALFALLYQSLFSVDREYKVEPQLCKNYRMSQDMKTYTFYIADATFTDGSRLTADDVCATLLAAKDSAYYGGRFTQITEISLTEDGGVKVKAKVPMENLPLLLDIPIIKASQLLENHPGHRSLLPGCRHPDPPAAPQHQLVVQRRHGGHRPGHQPEKGQLHRRRPGRFRI